jgi:predicted DNA-binding protein
MRDNKVKTSIAIRRSTRARLREMAKRDHRSLSYIVNDWLEERLAQIPRPVKKGVNARNNR